MTESDLLAAVELSPRFVGAHDRANWVGLFTEDGQVEDPVGSQPHRGPAQIARFYDTFIEPRDITFHRDLDIVCGSTVIRDLDLEVGMGSAVTMHIPAFLRYDLRQVGGEWRLTRMRAYWELPAMVGQFLRHGAHALPASGQLVGALLRNQRLGGSIGFAAGFRRAGARHKRTVEAFVDALAAGDLRTQAQFVAPDAVLTRGAHDAVDDLDAATLSTELTGVRITKIIAAGDTVVASVASGPRRGVLFADVSRRRNVITAVRYFPAR
ncbi:nuclear transport factor 2 family protein [Mycobacterium sp. M1]|uniref:Nuclear transport factor 2 family protein n=1 Tax=Mycolicibacter acidiphilus TaxID=2835306 RepID=A0ABS5RL25_9MYCO|nr:nuclear transport factor 2 family protein [Mycolicibacter acidiphilus]MBS9535008.1 nuclear transport factor 2 family protein [Mycolicibacter acidiphilus]